MNRANDDSPISRLLRSIPTNYPPDTTVLAISEMSYSEFALRMEILLLAEKFSETTLTLSTDGLVTRIVGQASNMFMLEVYPEGDSNYLAQAKIAALAQSLHSSLDGRYKVQITLPGQYAIVIGTEQTKDDGGRVIMSDMAIDGTTLDLQIRRKETLWKTVVRQTGGFVDANLQVLGPQQCKVSLHYSIIAPDDRPRDLTTAYMFMHFIHTCLGMRDIVLNHYQGTQLTLRTKRYWNEDTHQWSDRLMFMSERYERNGKTSHGPSAGSKHLIFHRSRYWLDMLLG